MPDPGSKKTVACFLVEVEAFLVSMHGGTVEHHETHISDVFLVGEFAYKFKKNVKFDFLDFSTLEKRRDACLDEVRLNHRLAPDVYLEVVDFVRNSDDQLCIADESQFDMSEVVESAVKMRRLSEDNTFDRMIVEDRLNDQHLDRLTELLVNFYSGLDRESITVNDYRELFRHHVVDNRNTLLDVLGESKDSDVAQTITQIHCRQLEFLASNIKVIRTQTGNGMSGVKRGGQKSGGWIVEGHGDLRPDHIYFDPDPLVIDCIEFNQEYRTIDIVDELAFLAMQCEYLGAMDTGDSIMHRVLSRLQCQPDPRLIAFYKSYRACVRAKVAALTKPQDESSGVHVHSEGVSRMLDLAAKNAKELGSPLVVLVRGLMGTGKTTIATKVSESIGAQHLQTDAIRNEIFNQRDDEAGYGENLYRKENREKVYDEMLQRMQGFLKNESSVVLDGTFLKSKLRALFLNAATALGARCVVVNCILPEDEALDRIRKRADEGTSLSDARPELYQLQKQEEEPITGNFEYVDIDTRCMPDDLIDQIMCRFNSDR